MSSKHARERGEQDIAPNFDRRTWLISIAVVVLSALVTMAAGTFTIPRTSGMGFVNHGGMWSDLLLLPVANAVIVPQLRIPRGRRAILLALAGVASLLTSIAMHVVWMNLAWSQQSRAFMFTDEVRDAWYLALTPSGWIHLGYMTVEMTLLVWYALSPMPRRVTLSVTAVLLLHIPVAILQPGWYVSGKFFSRESTLPAIFVALTTLLVAAVKLRVNAPIPQQRDSRVRD